MDKAQIENAFQGFLASKGRTDKSLTIADFPSIVLDYYKEVMFDGFDQDNESDMLLYQYGIYDWGNGKYFELDLTRQLYAGLQDTDDSHIFQQRLTFYFSPEKFEHIGSSNCWSNTFANLHEFERQILSSDGFIAALSESPTKHEVSVELVC